MTLLAIVFYKARVVVSVVTQTIDFKKLQSKNGTVLNRLIRATNSDKKKNNSEVTDTVIESFLALHDMGHRLLKTACHPHPYVKVSVQKSGLSCHDRRKSPKFTTNSERG